MPFVSAQFRPADREHTVDDVLGILLAAFPGSVKTADDWFLDRYEETKGSIARMTGPSRYVLEEDPVLQSILSARSAHPVTRKIRLRLPGGVELTGRISVDGLLLHADSGLEEHDVQPLRQVLEPVVTLTTFEFSNVRPPWKEDRPSRGPEESG